MYPTQRKQYMASLCEEWGEQYVYTKENATEVIL